MCEVFILVDVETTLLIIGSSIAAIFPLLKHLNLRLRGLTTPGNDYHTTGASHGGNNNNNHSGSTPLKTFGQWTSRPQRLRRTEEDEDDDDYYDDDETTLTRGGGDALAAGTRRGGGGGGGGGRSSSTTHTSLEGHIVKTTDVKQTWGPADAEEPKSAERKLGLTRGMF